MTASSYRDHPLESGRPPKWASSWGHHRRYGPWAAFEVGGVEQRMYWIYPGRFMMGSPEDEPGRYDREVQHEVTISQGYWMAETPCTQALWEAVMGDNPANFKSPNRPVDRVSWDGVQEFLQRLNDRCLGLKASLPTEAQWEYACRAGTKTATYEGPMEILGDNNAPVLDEIAWYGGNSGVGFELDNGYDSSDWDDRQYPHERAGSREVKTRRPNPWGLHDTLGNVWEWCQDWYDDYAAAPSTDPTGPSMGTDRVRRGGSWINDARGCRAAYRGHDEPSSLDDYVGFRVSRGPAPSPARQPEAEPGARAEPRAEAEPSD